MKFIVYHAKDFGDHKEEVEISSIEDLQKLQDAQDVDGNGDHYALIVDFHHRFRAPNSTWENQQFLNPQPAIKIYDDYIE